MSKSVYSRLQPHEVAAAIQDELVLLNLGMRQQQHDAVPDIPEQLSPPEYAAWTGKRWRLVFCVSGRMHWLELQEFTKMGRMARGQFREADQYPSTILTFVQAERTA